MLPPSPQDLGFLLYPSYYPNQRESVEAVIDGLQADQPRIQGLSNPTGSGKSLAAILVYMLSGLRTVVLTNTKALQTQYIRTLSEVTGMVDVRGQSSYQCRLELDLLVAEGACQGGYRCQYKSGGCSYYDAVYRAQKSPLVVTNYAFWLAQQGRDRLGLGDGIQLLICDEADTVLSALESHLTLEIARADMRRLLQKEMPPTGTDFPTLRLWARSIPLPPLEPEARDTIPSAAERRHFLELKKLCRAVQSLADAEGDWVPDWKPDRVVVRPVWPVDYIDLLYQLVPHIVLMSGTLPERTVELLSDGADYAYHSYPSPIPVERRRVTHIRTCDMRHATADMSRWTQRIDQIISGRLDRKGILHTTSYQRARRFMNGSRYRDSGILMTNGDRDLELVVAEFKRRSPPCVLVSPALTRGIDLPMDDCRYLIIGKIPWPLTTDPVVKARTAIDRDWPSYEAMITLVQEAGRAVRSAQDACEVLCTDDAWLWFWPKYQHFAPDWFAEAVTRSVDTVPPPLIY